jgi:N-acyl-D-amino-acid deacylase
MTYDLKISGGTIIDGSGAARYRGDVGITGGRIVALGDAPEDARRTIHAEGRVVTPGFVDVHTHYDAQILWDPLLTVSPWHGVTTAVMGNCGFTAAPTRPQHRDLIARTFERVEGMSLQALNAGLGEDWGFATYPEYLDLVEQRGMGINVASLIGHTAVRLWVMGPDAVERAATGAEVAEMQRIVVEALAAGSIGFSTSTTLAHFGFDGKPVPSRLSTSEERLAMASALRQAGEGVYCFMGDRGAAWEELIPIQRESGRHVVLAVVTANQGGPGSHREPLRVAAGLIAAGIPIYPQTAGRPVVFEMDMRSPVMLFMWPCFQPINVAGSDEERKRIYADAAFRKAFRDAADGTGAADLQTSAGADSARRRQSFGLIEISWYPPDPSLEGRPLRQLAAERGVHPVDLLLDMVLASHLELRFRMPVAQFEEEGVEEIFRDRNVVVGLGDGGSAPVAAVRCLLYDPPPGLLGAREGRAWPGAGSADADLAPGACVRSQ